MLLFDERIEGSLTKPFVQNVLALIASIWLNQLLCLV